MQTFSLLAESLRPGSGDLRRKKWAQRHAFRKSLAAWWPGHHETTQWILPEMGAHALYYQTEAGEVLRELGVPPSGKEPPLVFALERD